MAALPESSNTMLNVVNTNLIPVRLPINGQEYKFLVSLSTVKFMSENVERVKQQIIEKVPCPSKEDPLFIEFDRNANLIVPEVITNVEVTESDSNSLISACDSHNPTKEATEEGSSPGDNNSGEEPSGKRYNWTYSYIKCLLTELLNQKSKMKDFVITKALWSTVTKKINIDPQPTPSQCREKFYSLKRAYRKYINDTNKTGNKRPKPFLFETEMYDLLHDDPAFTPLVCKSSFGSLVRNDEEENIFADDETASSNDLIDSEKVDRKKRKRGNMAEEMKEYLKERDDKFLSALKEMQETQNKLMEKLIEKL